MEIVPNRIRGGMGSLINSEKKNNADRDSDLPGCLVRPECSAEAELTFYRSNIGGIIVSVMMQRLNTNHPDNYLLAMRILWGPIVLMLACWAFIPESPWYHAKRGNKEAAMKSLHRLYGNVEGFDFEEEYGIIARTLEHEKERLNNAPKFVDIFKGLNLVSILGLVGIV